MNNFYGINFRADITFLLNHYFIRPTAAITAADIRYHCHVIIRPHNDFFT